MIYDELQKKKKKNSQCRLLKDNTGIISKCSYNLSCHDKFQTTTRDHYKIYPNFVSSPTALDSSKLLSRALTASVNTP